MYSIDGPFGQVRIMTMSPSLRKRGLFWTQWIGWHRCNDLYQISRAEGHTHHLLLITIGGCGSLRIRGQEYRLTPGTVAFVPRDVPHAYRTPTDGIWEFYWVHPDGDLSNQFLDALDHSGPSVRSAEDVHLLGTRVERIMKFCQNPPAAAPYLISLELSSLFHEIALPFQRSEYPSLAKKAVRYLEQHAGDPIRLEMLAAELYVSVPHLIRVFRAEIGCTPHQYLMQYRLSLSRYLLKFSSLHTDEIASETGFSSSSHFISLFRRHFGCTPGQYRNAEEWESASSESR